MKPLKEICDEITKDDIRQTDKGRGFSNFVDLYADLFEPYRLSATKVFEIGIRAGGSIRMWQEYFSKASIYGLDIHNRSVERCKGERIKALVVDQGDPSQLQKFGNEYGKFDIGIEDGSHIWNHQIISFKTLWTYIKPGGLYVVEDILTSYEEWLSKSKSNVNMDYAQGEKSAVQYFKDLIDTLNFHGKDWDSIPKEQYTELQRTVDWVGFRANAIFVKKRKNA